MNKNNTDFIVGLVIIVSLFILIAGILWLKEIQFTRQFVHYTVLFPNIGTLQKGDPVRVNGVKLGSVIDIQLVESHVAVTIELDKQVLLTNLCTITVQNTGLLGERMVGIEASNQGTPFKPSTKNSITYITGHFDNGIAEAMGMMGTVLGDAATLIDTVKYLIQKTVGNTQFISTFQTLMSRIDSISNQLGNLIGTNKNELAATIQNIHSVSTQLKSIVNNNQSHVNSILSNSTQLTSNAVKITQRVDSISTNLHSIIRRIDQGKGSLGILTKDESLVIELRRSMTNLDSLIQQINKQGLLIRLKLFSGSKNMPSTIQKSN